MGLEGTRGLQARFRALTVGEKMMGRVGLVGVREAKHLVPRKTGNLGRTIRLGDVTPDSVEIRAGGERDVGYAAHVEYGTAGGSIIVPVRRKALAWGGARTLGGRLRKGAKPTNFARRVVRGATRAQPYLRPGLYKAAGEIPGVIVGVWNEAD